MAFIPHGDHGGFFVERFLGLQPTQEQIYQIRVFGIYAVAAHKLIKFIFSPASHHISDDLAYDLRRHPQGIGEVDSGVQFQKLPDGK